MSDTYRHKLIGKFNNDEVEFDEIRFKVRKSKTEYAANGRKFFDTKRRKAAEQDMEDYESGAY